MHFLHTKSKSAVVKASTLDLGFGTSFSGSDFTKYCIVKNILRIRPGDPLGTLGEPTLARGKSKNHVFLRKSVSERMSAS